MKSGLEGRNNLSDLEPAVISFAGLNEVRPRRPEQFDDAARKLNVTKRSQ